MTRPLCLITGASTGIGAACATLAAAQGYNLILTYNSDAAGVARVAADCEAAARWLRWSITQASSPTPPAWRT